MTRSFGLLAVAGWCLSTATVLHAQKALDRATALQLLQDRVSENVTGMISASPDSGKDAERAAAYQALEKAGVLSCAGKDSDGKAVCIPGQDAGDLTSAGPGLLAIVVTIKFPRGLWGALSRRLDLHFFPVQRRLVLPPSSQPDDP